MDLEEEYDPLEHKCIWCGKYAGRLFCSNLCRRKYEKEDMDGAIPIADCGICGDKFEMHNGNQKYCCMDCSRIALFLRRPPLGRKFLNNHPEYIEIYSEFGITTTMPNSPRKPSTRQLAQYELRKENELDRSIEAFNDLKYHILYEDKHPSHT